MRPPAIRGPLETVEVDPLAVRREVRVLVQTAPVVVVNCLSPVPAAETVTIWTDRVLLATASKVRAPLRPEKVAAEALAPTAMAAMSPAKAKAKSLILCQN
jgi:hypothetical protein